MLRQKLLLNLIKPANFNGWSLTHKIILLKCMHLQKTLYYDRSTIKLKIVGEKKNDIKKRTSFIKA